MDVALIGYSGFVGSNLCACIPMCKKYNSKNIADAFDSEPELLIYSAVPAAMFIANSNPSEDFDIVLNAIENIKKIKAKRVVLISTVAVYDKTINVDETHDIDDSLLLPYGENRYYLEKWVLNNYANSLVIRLPAIYGINLKKNFIYDFINIIPKMLNKEKYDILSSKNAIIADNYILMDDNFYHCKNENSFELYNYFVNSDFNALSFTDSRSIYQFYNLSNLWRDIEISLKNNLRLINLCTEPVSINELFKYITGKEFVNELNKKPFNYDIKTRHYKLFGGKNCYLRDKNQVLDDVKSFVELEIKRKWG